MKCSTPSCWMGDMMLPASVNPFRLLILLICALVMAHCAADGDTPEPCVTNIPESTCTPLYEPTFDQVYTQTIQPKCAFAGSACHAAEGAQGGLVLDDPDTAYAMLVQPKSSSARVLTGDPECSLLVERLVTGDPIALMPPGNALEEPEVCAIVTWIRNGAER